MECTVTAFLAGKQIAAGERSAVTRSLGKKLWENDGALLVFDDQTGRVTDLDYREVEQRRAGRPRLGVQSREVTLLPRHWEWLSGQPGGASATLRRLVESARVQGKSDRERRDAAYRFMQAMCGDFPGYEEALRALYAARDNDFYQIVDQWPADVGRYVRKLLGFENGSAGTSS